MQAGGMAIPKGSPPESPRYPRSRGPRLPGGHGKGPKWTPNRTPDPIAAAAAVQKIMAKNPGMTRQQALAIYHRSLKGRIPGGPHPHPAPPRRPVGMQEGGFLNPGDPGFDPMANMPSAESIAATELAARRARLRRLGTIDMDTDGDGIISQAERYAAIGAGPPVTTTNGTSGSPGPGEGGHGWNPEFNFPTEEELAENAPINYTIDPSLEPLQNLYGQVGASGEEEARRLINAILAADYGQLSSAQRDLIGSGLYRRIANRLGMTDAAGNPITALSTVKMTGDDGREVTPSGSQALSYLSGMEGLDEGAGIDLLLNFLQGRVRTPTKEQLPPSGPFGTYDPSQQYYNPYQQYYNFMMPQPPQFGQPYMSQMPFLPYAGMANPMNPSIFGGYGYGYGPSAGMAPLSYYGGFQPLPGSQQPPAEDTAGENGEVNPAAGVVLGNSGGVRYEANPNGMYTDPNSPYYSGPQGRN